MMSRFWQPFLGVAAAICSKSDALRSSQSLRPDAEFKQRAEKILWCYGNAGHLAQGGLWVVCVDEIPNFQILERNLIRRAVPGLIERQEFEYIRHGTVTMLMFLVVHSGKM